MVSAAMATAFFAMSVAIGAIRFVSYLNQLAALNFAQAPPPLDAVFQVAVPVAAIGVLNTALTFIHVGIDNGGAAAGRRRTMEVLLCVSIGVLHLFLQPGAMDSVQDLPLDVAVSHVFLPAAATVTYFLCIVLIYVHVRTGGAGGAAATAGNIPVTTSVKLLTTVTLAAALVTVVLTLTAASLAFYTE